MRTIPAGGVRAGGETSSARTRHAVRSRGHVRVEFLSRQGGVVPVHQALRVDAGREIADIVNIRRSRQPLTSAGKAGRARGAGQSAPAIMIRVDAGIHLVCQGGPMRAIVRAGTGQAGRAGGARGAGQSSSTVMIRVNTGIHLICQGGPMRTVMRAAPGQARRAGGARGAGQPGSAVTIRVHAGVCLVRQVGAMRARGVVMTRRGGGAGRCGPRRVGMMTGEHVLGLVENASHDDGWVE